MIGFVIKGFTARRDPVGSDKISVFVLLKPWVFYLNKAINDTVLPQFIGQWAWVIAPWFWVILYDPEWFPSGADQGVRELSVWVALSCTLFAIVPAIFLKSKSTLDRTDFLPINANYVLKRDMQQDIHDSVEDALTAFELYEKALEWKQQGILIEIRR